MSELKQGPRSPNRSLVALFAGAALLAASLGCGADDPQCPAQLSYAAHVAVTNTYNTDFVLESRANGLGDWTECKPGYSNSIECGLGQQGEVTFRATTSDGRQVEATETISGDVCGPHFPPEDVILRMPDR